MQSVFVLLACCSRHCNVNCGLASVSIMMLHLQPCCKSWHDMLHMTTVALHCAVSKCIADQGKNPRCRHCGVVAEADEHEAEGEIDDDTVVVEDDDEADDSDAVMVDALEALRLSQPHMAHASSTACHSPHTDENQRPQTATGSRQAPHDNSFSNGGISHKGYGSSKGSSSSRRRTNHRLVPFGEGPMWAMFGGGTNDDSDCNGATHEFGGNSSLVQLGLQSRLAEAAEDMHSVAGDGGEGQRSSQDATFNSAQYWKTPLAMPQDIENA